MKKIIDWIKNYFATEKEQDILINFAEKKEKGMPLSEAEKEKALKTAIKIVKDTKDSKITSED